MLPHVGPTVIGLDFKKIVQFKLNISENSKLFTIKNSETKLRVLNVRVINTISL